MGKHAGRAVLALLALLLAPEVVASTAFATDWSEFDAGGFCSQAARHGWSCSEADQTCNVALIAPALPSGQGLTLTGACLDRAPPSVSHPVSLAAGDYSVRVRVGAMSPSLVFFATADAAGEGRTVLYSDFLGRLHFGFVTAEGRAHDAAIDFIPFQNPKDYVIAFESRCAAGEPDVFHFLLTDPLRNGLVVWSRDISAGGCVLGVPARVILGGLVPGPLQGVVMPTSGTWSAVAVEQPAQQHP